MKRLVMMLIMVLVMVMEVVASDVVVFDTMDSQDAFVRYFNIGTTHNVIVIEDKEMFNNIALPTFASAQESNGIMAIVKGSDEFASYAVKFSKEEKVTYLYVGTTLVAETTSVETTSVEKVEVEEVESTVPSINLITLPVVLVLTMSLGTSNLTLKNKNNNNLNKTISLNLTVATYEVPTIKTNLKDIETLIIEGTWTYRRIELNLYDVFLNDKNEEIYIYGLENKFFFNCINLNTGEKFYLNRCKMIDVQLLISKGYSPYKSGDVVKSIKDNNAFIVINDNGDYYHCYDIKTSTFFELSKCVKLNNVEIIDNKSLEDLFNYLKFTIKEGQYICSDGFIIVVNINGIEVVYEKYDFDWNMKNLSSTDIFNFNKLIKPVKHEKDVVGLIKKNEKYLTFFHNKINEYSLPIGTVENEEKPELSLKREMKEELGINILKFKFVEKRTFKIFENLYSVCYFYYIEEYNGKINNKEPNKHSNLGYRNHLDEVRFSVQTKYIMK